MTPLTPEQYSELVCVLEVIREQADETTNPIWYDDGEFVQMTFRRIPTTPFTFVYLTQWFHKLGPITDRPTMSYACTQMVVELCEERCAEPEYQNDAQAAFGGIVQTPQG